MPGISLSILSACMVVVVFIWHIFQLQTQVASEVERQVRAEVESMAGTMYQLCQSVYEASKFQHRHALSIMQQEAGELLAGSHLLVVKDNEINLQVARELLEKVGSRVSAADNGKQAVERAAVEQFDCILMDLQMPVMDGLTAAQEIRKGPAGPDLPIIAMSANAITGTRE